MSVEENENDLVDLSYLRNQMGGKKEQINSILNLFIEHTPPAIIEIKQHLDKQQWHELKSKVHAIKSYYAYVGNNGLLQKLMDWEHVLKTNPQGYNHLEIITELETKTTSIVERLKQIVQQSI